MVRILTRVLIMGGGRGETGPTVDRLAADDEAAGIWVGMRVGESVKDEMGVEVKEGAWG